MPPMHHLKYSNPFDKEELLKIIGKADLAVIQPWICCRILCVEMQEASLGYSSEANGENTTHPKTSSAGIRAMHDINNSINI